MYSKKLFKISELFDVYGTKSLDEGYLDFETEGINFVGRVNENNGVKGKIKYQKFPPNESNTITATVIGNYKYVKYQEEPYYCSQNINKLIPKFKITPKVALYFITCIKKFVSQYNGQQGGYKIEQLKNFSILLPVNKNEEPDFHYMEHYISELEEERISELEEERISELEAYLKINGFDNYELTQEELSAIENLKNKKIQFDEFNITGQDGIFNVKNTHSILQEWIIPNSGTIPYVTAGVGNNSITTNINAPQEWIEEGNSIMIGGKTLVITYQENDYVSNDSHNLALYLKDERYKTENIHLFLVSALYKSLKPKYEWGNSISKTKIQKDKIKLPIDENKNIDYKFMETYISGIKKLSIRNVVDWKDKIIKITKDICNK